MRPEEPSGVVGKHRQVFGQAVSTAHRIGVPKEGRAGEGRKGAPNRQPGEGGRRGGGDERARSRQRLHVPVLVEHCAGRTTDYLETDDTVPVRT